MLSLHPMQSYLTETLAKLKSRNYRGLHIVIGNESCDLDSAVCAIVYAAFLYFQHEQIKCKVCTRVHRDELSYLDDIYIPILNVDREDFELKTEVVYCLREQGIESDQLIFRNDFDLQHLTAAATGDATVVLVDHHVLAARDQHLANMVTEIIDHRPIDKREWKYKDDTRVTIEPVGSCCSLVTQRVRAWCRDEPEVFFTAFRSAAEMLHAGIILDTVNFSKQVDKARPTDVEAAEFLEGILKPADVQADRERKLQSLTAARRDVSSLSADQLLRKDVKIIEEILVPSLPILVQEFLSLPDAEGAVLRALSVRACSLAVLLGRSDAGAGARDMVVRCVVGEEHVATQLASHLSSWSAPPLQLVAASPPPLYFQQLNVAASRKQYVAAIAAFQPQERTQPSQ